MPYLIFQNQAGRETISFPDDGEFHIGRSNNNDITVLDDPLVSRNHCLIYANPAGANYILRDLSSSNGTQLNGETLSGAEAPLSEGDIVRVGNAEFVFCVENPERFQSTTTSIMKLGKFSPDAESAQPHETLKFIKTEGDNAQSRPGISPSNFDSPSSLPQGLDINGYRIVRTLSPGDASTVYLAYQESVKRTVILKMFSTKADAEAKASFRELAQKIGRLNHSNLVHYFDCGTFDEYCYLVMAFMSEGNLEERISRNAPFAEREALPVIRKIAEAMNYAMSEHCLIHLCLKPASVLFGDSGEPVLANVGLAPWLARNDRNKRTYVFGDPAYMSPEQALDQRADWRSDLYSLGIIFYEMLSGKTPYTASDEKEMIQLHASAQMVFPQNLSREAVGIIRTMTAKDPERRYSSWDSFLQALKPLENLRRQQAEPQNTQDKPQMKLGSVKKLVLKR